MLQRLPVLNQRVLRCRKFTLARGSPFAVTFGFLNLRGSSLGVASRSTGGQSCPNEIVLGRVGSRGKFGRRHRTWLSSSATPRSRVSFHGNTSQFGHSPVSSAPAYSSGSPAQRILAAAVI